MSQMFTSAIQAIDALESRRANVSINWEHVLARQYCALFPSARTIVDVGAHEGMHSAIFGSIAKRVLCFEPIPELAARLLERFHGTNVIIHETALGDVPSDRTLFSLNLSSSGESGLVPRVSYRDCNFKNIFVRVERLDSFGIDDLDFIKLDCEGAELKILAGAARTITDSRPVISIEYGHAGYSVYGFNKLSLLHWSTMHDYVVCDLFGHLLTDPTIYARCVDRYYWDYLLLPQKDITTLMPLLK
jgi:FkbM family methyltransferase